MYRKKQSGWVAQLDFVIIDIICMQIAFLAGYMIRHGLVNPYRSSDYLSLALVCILLDFATCIIFDAFRDARKRGYYIEALEAAKHVAITGGFLILYLFSMKNSSLYSRIFFFTMIPIYYVLTYITRIGWKTVVRKTNWFREKKTFLLAASKDNLEKDIADFMENGQQDYTRVLAAALDENLTGSVMQGVDVVADSDSLLSYIQKEWVDEVLLDAPIGDSFPYELYRGLREMGVVVHTVLAKNSDMSLNRQELGGVGDFVVMTASLNSATSFELFMKRAMDIIGGLVGCVFTLLFMILIGPWILIASPGPLFFSQERIGRNGRHFKMYKFRSMYPDAEKRKAELMEKNKIQGGLMFKMKHDPRVIGNKVLEDGTMKTGIGEFIRKYSIDEFPQFWNVLKGDMSLVGTRPPLPDEWQKYEPRHRARMSFRPGVTGLWQISGRSNIENFEEVVRLDREYIDNWNLGLDVRILLKTVGVVFGKNGAM